MSYITDNLPDGELNTALTNFNTVCAANATALGLSPANLTEIAGASSAFTTQFNGATAAKAAAKSAVANKDIQKKTSRGIVGKWAKTFRANPNVPDNLLEQLMLPPHKTPGTKTNPTQPMNLVASADGNGVVKLTWSRNGNREGTQFLVESRNSPTADWEQIGGTTQAKFTNQAVPGQYVAYRVTATRRGLFSPASTPVVLWENGGGMSLSLAA